MKITILTLFPGMFEGFLNESIIKRAQDKKTVSIEIVDIRKYAVDDYRTIDDRPFGGGAGMVLMAEPIIKAIKGANKTSSSQKKPTRTILTSAGGKTYSQKKALAYSKLDHLIIIAGHYEGVDERVMSHIDEEVSIGDYVLTGGELPAAIIIDSVVRLLPGVLKKEDATKNESFAYASINRLIEACGEDATLKKLKDKGTERVKLLEYPHYTRPQKYDDTTVPDTLLSGNHKEIEKWKLQQAYKKTLKERPDLLS